jgi:hypothetical protein
VVVGGTLAASRSLTSGGNLTVDGDLVLGGALGLAGGTTIFGSGGRLTATGIDITGAAVTVAENFAFAGGWSEAAGIITVNAGDTLSLNGASIHLGGTISGPGAVALAGNAITIASGAMLNVSHVTLAGTNPAVTIAGNATIDSVWTQLKGSLDVAAGATLDLGGIGDRFAAAIGGGGTLAIESGSTSLIAGTALSVASVAVSGATTTLSVGESLAYAGRWTQTGGTVNVGAGDTLTLSGPSVTLAGAVIGAGTLRFGGGTTQLLAGVRLVGSEVAILGSATQVNVATNLGVGGFWSQAAGTVSVSAGHTLKLTGAGDLFTGTLAGAGVVVVAGASAQLKNISLVDARTEITASSASLAGAVNLTGLLTVASPDLVVSGSAQLGGGGVLQLSNVASNKIVGSSSLALLDNVAVKIEGAGQLGAGSLRLTNEAGGIIDGNASTALIIDTGTSRITNFGLIEATGPGGVTIAGSISNAGTLAALGGNLTVVGAVAGAGTVQVNAGTAAFGGAFAEAVAFGASGILALASSTLYSGTISNFSKTGKTSLDLEDIVFGAETKASYSGTTTSGVLTVTDGIHTARIKMAGDFTKSGFILAADGDGGTVVTDPLRSALVTPPLVAAIAGFAPTPSSAAPILARGGPSRIDSVFLTGTHTA